MMKRVTSREARVQIAKVLDAVQQEPIEITRTGGKTGGVLLSLERYAELLKAEEAAKRAKAD
ncbi:type II toxin-antitoxin system Phd/YefM family antitoxin [Salmonella enterica]|nr:type II toxin-antitoxin system Phd/YefM family antitoxin [Salmonella enterica]